MITTPAMLVRGMRRSSRLLVSDVITLLWSPHRHWDETSSGITKCSLQLSQLWKDTKQSDANSIETVHELHHFLHVPTTQAPTVTKYNAFIRESENTFMDTKDMHNYTRQTFNSASNLFVLSQDGHCH